MFWPIACTLQRNDDMLEPCSLPAARGSAATHLVLRHRALTAPWQSNAAEWAGCTSSTRAAAFASVPVRREMEHHAWCQPFVPEVRSTTTLCCSCRSSPLIQVLSCLAPEAVVEPAFTLTVNTSFANFYFFNIKYKIIQSDYGS